MSVIRPFLLLTALLKRLRRDDTAMDAPTDDPPWRLKSKHSSVDYQH